MIKYFTTFFFYIILTVQTATAQSVTDENRATGKQLLAELTAAITKVNDYWQSHNSPKCRAFWDNAAYFTANQKVYRRTLKKEYLDYAIQWAEYNHWQGATQKDKWIMYFSPTGKSASKSISTSTNGNIVLSASNEHWK